MPHFRSLFWQLYLSIVIALLSVGALFIGMMLYIDNSTDSQDFYIDTRLVANPIKSTWQLHNDINPILLQQLKEESFFDIALLDKASHSKTLKSLTHKDTIESTHIYETTNGLLVAIEALPNTEKFLIISDIEVDPEATDISETMQLEFSREIKEDDQRALMIQSSIALALLIIGIALIIMIKRISKHLQSLITTSHAWREGNFEKRAVENAPEPLNELAINFNNMACNLDQANQEQQVLMHAISHELRTPLSKLHLALDLVKRQQPDTNPLINDLDRYVDELDTLTHQILMFSKITNDKSTQPQEPFSLQRLLLERANELKRLFTDKNLTIDSDTSNIFIGSSFYCQILIDNIVSNAFKYSNQKVRVRYYCSLQNHTLQIDDDGPGIPEEKHQAMLKPFSREDESRNKTSGGFGLGLAITKAIVDLHNGSLHMSRSELGGLCLIIQFPAHA